MRIDQAIFTSVEGSGYRLVAQSPGIDADESRELSHWGPSHDSLLEAGSTATSVNFHRLSSGRYCIAKTSPAGSEYSGRGGWCVYTQSLVIAAEDFVRFAINPFALIRAATAQGRMQVLRKINPQLEPLRISGKTPTIDHALLAELLATDGLHRLLAAVDAVSTHASTMLIVDRNRQQLMAGLINCLPVECRTELSFTTGLKPSPRRPFRVTLVPEETPEVKRFAREQQAALLRLSGIEAYRPVTQWGRCLNHLLADGRTHALGSAFAVSRDSLSFEQLDELATSLANLEALGDSQSASAVDRSYPRLALVAADDHAGSEYAMPPSAGAANASSRGTAAGAVAVRPSDYHPPTNTCDSLDVLEALDDTVFEALAGDSAALARLKDLWPSTVDSCGRRELAESREHYIRRALATWRRAQDSHGETDLQKAVQAIEVVCTLFGE